MNLPHSIQVSFVEGCNRRCSFCGICAIREKPMQDLKFMSIPVLNRVIDGLVNLENEPRIELAMHGEPTLHPFFHDFVKAMRVRLPDHQISLTTNGFGLFSGKNGGATDSLRKTLSSGVDFILLDTYNPGKAEAMHKARVAAHEAGVSVVDFYKSDISPWQNHRRKLTNTIILMDDIGDRNGEKKSRTLFNHAGNSGTVPKESAPKKATCTIPFREISVCWNGDVCTCCMDWKHELVAGNVLKSSIKDIWFGRVFTAVRRALASKNRDFRPCDVCNCGPGTRPGLLEKQFQPTEDELMLLKKGGERI